MNYRIIIAAGIALLAGIVASIYVVGARQESHVKGLPLEQLFLHDLDGREQAFSQWQGKVLLVNFWATWCPPCVEEVPVFIELRKKYADTGFEIAGVAIDDIDKAKQFGESMKVDYPLLYGQTQGMALMQKLGNRVGGLPYSVLYDRDGNIVATKSGIYSHEELENLIKKYL